MSEALRALAGRVVGPAAERVEFEPLEGPRGFEYEAAGGVLKIRATDAIAAAAGLHAYLKRACGRQVCWDTPLPLGLLSLPDAPATRRAAATQAGYYLNFCTFGYTAAYWDWPRWEREIDWMALHGITMPLAVTGHEAVLGDVYCGLGMDDAAVRAFLGGPGYLPWQFMGCLDGFPAPLPTGWVEARAELGARIVARERELGMTPVLPAFTGHVPAELGAAGTTTRDWMGFTTHFLDVGDPRFVELSCRVVQAQRERLGTGDGELYAADPFIEMTPPSDDPAYLAELARTVLAGLRAEDAHAVWVMQTWPFSYHAHYWTDERVAALIDAVPDDALVLLDLWGERVPQWPRFGGFRGKRWLWCALHGFGGRADLFGDLEGVRDELEAALASPDPPWGVGLAMEATETNHVVYELVAERPWEPADDLRGRVVSFARRRYGTDAEDAWSLLLRTVYSAPPAALEPLAFKGVVTARPRYGDLLDPTAARAWVDAARWYDPADLVAAWRALLAAAEGRPRLPSLDHDLAVVGATAMARAIDELFVAAVEGRDDGLLEAFADLDALLATRPELRLDTWEAAAGTDARRIVSVWTTPDPHVLHDYSARLWSGLVGGYYRERWRCWLEGLGAPDDRALAERLRAVDEAFVARGVPAPAGDGSTVLEARRLLDRYAGVLTRRS